MTTFKDLGLDHKILKSLDDLGFVEPSPIQEKSIPFILKSRKDLIALAQTGTGKTAAFGLPIINQLKPGNKKLQAIIICPIRELCLQISEDLKKFCKYSDGISTTAVYGGARIDIQINALRRGTNIVVGTPGRVHDLIERGVLKLQDIKWVVLDEADEMLDMGFKDDLDAILEQTPDNKQTLLFSATMSKSVRAIADEYMNDIEEISIGEKNIGAKNVSHEYYIVGARDRFEALKRILDSLPGVYGILFCRTRNETQIVADKLKQFSYDAEPIHGDISQSMRTKIMERFKRKQIHLLVATDVAARGIDVSDLTHVINYNLPDQNEIYTHRSGRTGRAKKSGISISIITPRDTNRITQLENMIGKGFAYKKIPSGEDICKKQIDNFIKEVEETNIENIGKEKYLEEAVEKLKKISKEDIIKLFIANKFNHLMNDRGNNFDLNAKAKPEKMHSRGGGNQVNLKINFGKKHGFDVKALFGIINANRELKGADVGRISLNADYSVFSVEKEIAETIIKKLQGSKFRGNRIKISRSNEVIAFERSKKRDSNRRFDRNKKFGGRKKRR